MTKEVYTIMYWLNGELCVYGYYTNRNDADKYCAIHSKRKPFVTAIPCVDNQEDFSKIEIKYEHMITFYRANSEWIIQEEPNAYTTYISEKLRDDSVKLGEYSLYMVFKVNLAKNNRKLAEEIARDTLRRFLNFCQNNPTVLAAENFNIILNLNSEALNETAD